MGKWRKKFNDEHTDVHNEQRSARPVVSDEAGAKGEEREIDVVRYGRL